MSGRPKRKAIPVSVQIEVLMRALGLERHEFEFDHDPPLALRPIDPETDDTIPPANDPAHIFIRRVAEHKAKTKQDVARIAKAKRQAGETGQRARRERKGPTMQSSPFPNAAEIGRRFNWKTGRIENA